MNTFTINDIRSWRPCYDPARHLPESWSGTALDILRHDNIPPQDKLWVVCRTECIDERTLRLFAVWCARKMLSLIPDPDRRLVAACDVAERYANAEATDNDLTPASLAAEGAARDMRAATRYTGVWGGLRADVWDTADAAWAAKRNVRDAAWGAAWAVPPIVQVARLVAMLERDKS